MTIYAVVYRRDDGGHVLSCLYDDMAAAELHAAVLPGDLLVQAWSVRHDCQVGLPPEEGGRQCV